MEEINEAEDGTIEQAREIRKRNIAIHKVQRAEKLKKQKAVQDFYSAVYNWYVGHQDTRENSLIKMKKQLHDETAIRIGEKKIKETKKEEFGGKNILEMLHSAKK